MKSQLSELNKWFKNIVEKWTPTDILVITVKNSIALLFRNPDQGVVCSRRVSRETAFTDFQGDRSSAFQIHGAHR